MSVDWRPVCPFSSAFFFLLLMFAISHTSISACVRVRVGCRGGGGDVPITRETGFCRT